jgi:hypothetical protein
MRAISDNLIHFLGRALKDQPDKQLDVFRSIIENGLKFSALDTRFAGSGIVFNKGICFTDIPLNFLDQHTAVYGKFGIGFKKSFVKNAGGNPARYFVDHVPAMMRPKDAKGQSDPKLAESRGLLFQNLIFLHRLALELKKEINDPGGIGHTGLYNVSGKPMVKPETLNQFIECVVALLSFDKPIGDLGPPRDDTNDTDVFYNEREWRVIPYKVSIANGSVVSKEGEFYLPFGADALRMIIVPNNSIRKQVMGYFPELEKSEDPRLRSFAENLPPVFNYDDIIFF